MQTRKFGFRGITLALAGVLTLGLAACEDTDVVPAPQPTVLDVSPDGPIDLEVGDQITLVSNVTNPAAGGATVTWTASGDAVTITPQGNNVQVSAANAGVATVTATVAGNQGSNLSQSVVIRVSGGETPPPADTAQVTIEALINNENNPVNENDVEGTFFVRLDVTRGRADSLHVLLNDNVRCRQNFTAGAASQLLAEATSQAEFVCAINTLAVDTATGAPLFANGPATITANLIDDGQVIATASRAITVGNENAVTADVSADTSAIGEAGLLWHGGDVTVTATPVVFGGSNVSRITVVAFNDADGDGMRDAGEAVIATKSDTDASNGFSVTFDADDDLEEETYPALRFQITTRTAAGGEGPDSVFAAIRYDNEAPTAGDLATDANFNWINERNFADVAYDDDDETDAGVGNVTVEFFAADAGDTGDADDVIDEGEAVQTGADLDESNSSTEYRLAARVCDALGNCQVIGGVQRFGVDVGDPEIELELEGGQRDGTINPTDVEVAVTDEISGPAAQPLLVSATRYNADHEGGECAIGDEDEDCEAERATTVALPTENAYYTYTVIGVDEAGNESEPQTFTVLLDDGGVDASGLRFGATIEPGDEETFEASVEDDVDLESASIGFMFAGAPAAFTEIVAAQQEIGDFGLPLTVEEDLEVTTTYIGSIYVAGTWYNASQVFARGEDVAGNTDEVAAAAPNAGAASRTLPGGAAFQSFNITTPVGGDADDVEGNETVTAVVDINNPEASTPFERVNFFIRGDLDGDGDVENMLIGSDESAAQVTRTGERTFTYTANLSSADFGDADYILFAIGLQDDGDAVASNQQPITIDNDD